ncbi:Phage tail fiber repeat protein [compost metagenome]
MPEKCSFFDSTADDPREYPAREFAEYFSRFVGNGIFGGGAKLKVEASGTDANVTVGIGYAWINGYLYGVYDAPLTLPISPATNQPRIDRVILRLDTSTPVRAIKAMVLQGTPTSIPSVPAITRSGNIYDLSLAQVLVAANTSIVLPENITDERLNNLVCGIVTGLISQADTTAIFNQFQAWFNTKTAQYQQQWVDFIESIQDEGFATTQYVDQKIAAIPLPPNASTTVKGIVQLSDAINSSSISLAPTANAVKKAYDRAEQAFQSASNGKSAVAAAITGKGVPASGSDTFAVLAQKIGEISAGFKLASGSVTGDNTTKTIANLAFKPRVLICYLSKRFYFGNDINSTFNGWVIAYDIGDGVVYENDLENTLRVGGHNPEYLSINVRDVIFGANSVSFAPRETTNSPSIKYYIFGN